MISYEGYIQQADDVTAGLQAEAMVVMSDPEIRAEHNHQRDFPVGPIR